MRPRPARGGIIAAVLSGAVVLGVVLAAAWSGTFATSPEATGADGSPVASASATDSASDQASATPAPSPSSTPSPTPTPTPSPTPTPDATFTILAAGDVLPHTTVLRRAAEAATDGGWDFSPLWEPLDPWIAGADLALCHLEVPVVPEGVEPSGYPLFGAPATIAADLLEAGWDGCSTASNHSLDRGWNGVVATLDAFDAVGLGHVGTARTEQESQAWQVYTLERGGQQIDVAQLSSSWGTNGLPLPADAPWSVQLNDADQLIAKAVAARAAGADLVVASIHWGVEYTDDPVAAQTELAQVLADSGEIDLVIGHHPHVPQRMEMLAGGPGGDGMWVAYSLGNYISNQDAECCRSQTGTGLLMWASVVKPADGPARVTGLEWTAVPGDRVGHQRIYAMPDLLADRTETPLLTLGRAELERRQQQVLDVIGDVPERLDPPVATGDRPVVVPRAS